MRYLKDEPIKNPYDLEGKPYRTLDESAARDADGKQIAQRDLTTGDLLRLFTARFNEKEPKATHGDTLHSLAIVKASRKAKDGVIEIEEADFAWFLKAWEAGNRGAELFEVLGAAFFDVFQEASKERPEQPCTEADGTEAEESKVVKLAPAGCR